MDYYKIWSVAVDRMIYARIVVPDNFAYILEEMLFCFFLKQFAYIIIRKVSRENH